MYKLLKKLKEQNIHIHIQNDNLKVKFNGDKLPEDTLREIKENKEELIKFLKEENNQPEYKEIHKVPVNESYALSSAQKRLWMMDQVEDGAITYNMPSSIVLNGFYDINEFEKAIAIVISRHEILRTIFKEDASGEVRQWVQKPSELNFKIDYKDYRNIEGKEQDKLVREYTEKDTYTPFDLEKGPLLRAAMLQLKDDSYVFYFNMHHIISDGWSMNVLIRDVQIAYQAIIDGQENPFSELRIQYKDYAAWQLSQVEESSFSEHKEYWTNQLSGDLPILELPIYKKRPELKTSNGSILKTNISKETVQKLNQFCVERKGSLFMGFVAVLNTLFNRYTQEEDFIVGTPVAGRDHVNLEDQIGFYVNTLALRNQVTVKDTFEDIFTKVKETTLGAFEHQMYPFDQLVQDLELTRDVSRSVIFDVMLSVQNGGDTTDPSNLVEEGTIVDKGTFLSKFDLDFNFLEVGDYICLDVIYNTDIYEKGTVVNLIENFKELLVSLLNNPTKAVGELEYIAPKQKTLLLDVFNDTDVAYPQDETIIDLFEKQVKKTPDNIAVVFEEITLTYQELNEKINQLASYLRDKYEISPDDLVGIKLDRSEKLIIAILAALKSGAAYVPIDITYPKERIDYIQKDTNCKVIIDQNILNDFEDLQEQYPIKNLEIVNKPSDLAYVIYTSGTTGTPKGAMIEHQNVVNILYWYTDNFQISEETKSIHLTEHSFDPSILDIFGTLMNGGTHHVISKELVLSNEKVVEYIKNEKITILNYIATYLDNLLADIPKIESVKTIIVGGEPLSEKIKNNFLRLGYDLYNQCGPTETTVDVLSGKMTDAPVNLGRPISNIKMYILDDLLQPVNLGSYGKLYVAGAGVSRGYLNRPDLTNEKYISNPFNSVDRLYDSGDIARWLPNGDIEIFGRKDHQVKIRGYRIELGEIETRLEAIPSIDQAIVLDKENQNGKKYLVAYVIGKSFDKSKVISELSQKLPEYMVPQVYMELESFPLTNTGKVNRRKFPEPNESSIKSNEEYVAPRNEKERDLAVIWQNLLGVKQVGIFDNFFSLGGDSIIAIQVVSRAKKDGIILKVKDIFIHQNIEAICKNIKDNVVIIGEQGVLEGEMELLPIHHNFFEKGYAKHNHYNQSILLETPKNINDEIVEQAISQLCKKHDALRLSYENKDGKYLGRYNLTIPNLELVSLDEDKPLSESITDICNTYQSSLSIEEGIIARFVLLKTPLEEESNRLFITIHHLAIDGVSWRILLEDLSLYVTALVKGETLLTEDKSTSYRQWQEALQKYATTEKLLSEFPYWKSVASKVKSLPQDTSFDQLSTYADNNHYTIRLEKEQTQNLLQECHHAFGTEINDLLLAALSVSLSNWTQNSETVIGLEGHGREEIFEDIDLNKTVGWFTSLYPVVLKNVDNDLEATIVETKENLRATPNKGIGYGVLRYLSTDEKIRSEVSADIEQLEFNYLGRVDSSNSEETIFKFATESKGEEINLSNFNAAKITINSIIINGQLTLNWSYDTNRFSEKTIEQVANNYRDVLIDIISLCKSKNDKVLTPSDYGLNGLVNYDEIKSFKEINHAYPIQDIYRLSPLQEGMVFHSLLDENPNLYVSQLSFDLEGEFDINHFKTSWELLVKKHSVLRTSFFHETMSVPVQCVYSTIDLPLRVIDFTEKEQSELDHDIQEVMDKEANTPFSLDVAPLFRLILILLPGNRTKLIYSSHHILSDGWSSPIVFGEFISNYQSLVNNEMSLIDQKEDNYKDFIDYISKKDRTEILSYWRNQLSDLTSPSLLPFPSSSDFKDKVQGNTNIIATKEKEYVTRLETYIKANHLTVNTVVQGVWSYLLSQYTNNETVVFGTVISGRPSDLKDVETRVGMYINTIPLCTTLNDDNNITNWLTTIQDNYTVSREEYGHSSLTEIQKQINISRELFDSLLVFENYPLEAIKSADSDLNIGNIQVKQQNSFPLTISVNYFPGQTLNLTYEFDSKIISKDSIEMIKKHFNTLLESILESEKVGELEYLTPSEREELLNEFNNVPVATTIDSNIETVLDLFKVQVKSTPDAIAIAIRDKKLTYSELDTLSNKLAHCLIDNYDILPGDKVGIKLDRNEWMVTSILAVLKSGAAYVPIDPEYSSSREEHILNDSEVKMVITETNYMFDFSEYEGTLFSIDIEFEADQHSDSSTDVTLSRKALAYIIYTSGSTGKPKGVMVAHGSLLNYLKWGKETYLDNNQLINNNFGLYTSLSFDLTITSLFMPLISGGILQIFGQGEISNTLKKYAEAEISCIKLTPAHISVLQELDIENSHIELAIVGGDALLQHHIDILRKINPKMKVYNEYGPTEATVGCMIYDVPFENDTISIGRPILNTQIYVLNSSNKLVPNGIAGEICIGGVGLAKGYLNRPELTTEKFIPHPFNPNQLMYKTGDVGRWLPDGNMEYLGRQDNQVKIRGYRIELGEVEQQLLSKEGINAVSVIANVKANGEKELVAYIVFETPENTITELRRFLSNKLPAYMIPSHFVALDKMPLTVNGKVNKKLLPDVEGSEIYSGVEYIAPRNEIEEKLANLWEEHLDIDTVGIKNDYFQLGGDSIKMIRFINIINTSFEVELPIATFYENPTIEGLSAFLSEGNHKSNNNKQRKLDIEASIDTLEASILSSHPFAHNIESVYPMSDVQIGMILMGQLARENKEFGIFHDQWLFQLGLVDVELLTSAMELMVEKHETLRTSYDLYQFDTQVQIIHKEIPVHIGFEDISGHSKEVMEEYVEKFLENERVHNPFNITEGPLWRINIFQINETEIIYVLQFHHSIMDGWSEKSLRVELFETYNTLKTQKNYRPSLIKCTMRDSIISDILELENQDNISYWKNMMSDYKRLDIFTENITDKEVGKVYHKDFYNQIIDKCKKDNITPKSLFFSAYVYVLSLLSLEKDITVGLVTHRRPMVEDGDKLLGCFLNSVPFRVNMPLSEKCSWLDYIKLIETGLKELKGKDRFSLNGIVDLTGESSNQNPFFDVLFNYVDFHILNELYDNEDFQSQHLDKETENFRFEDFERTNTYMDFTVSSTINDISVIITTTRTLKSNHQLEDLIQYFDNFLNNYLQEDNSAINSINILSDVEKNTLITDFNDTYVEYPKNKTIVDLFEEQVKKSPNATAVVYMDKELSYLELDKLSNRLANYLLSNFSVKSDDLIGIKLNRNEWMIVAILGVLKSGGAYVPIDPDYPTSRIAFIEQDSNCKLCIDNDLISEFIVDNLSYSENKISNKRNVHDLAYVIYTSGSTGTPKGVMIEHKGIANTILALIDTFDFREQRKALQFASFSFDASIWECLTALLSGSSLYIVDDEIRNDPKEFEIYIQNNDIDITILPPAYLKLLDMQMLKGIKTLITGGESAVYNNVKEFLELGEGAFYNAYGPTEVSICGSTYSIPNINSLKPGEIPIGSPIANASIFLLDEFNNIQPLGAIGEICIGGAGIARGYLNRPELTAEKFIANPFVNGERLYKTGDLGRWLPDGNLEYYGRKDDQVKIRGHRIELGEIESKLLLKDGIREAVALAVENESKEKQLVIYYVSEIEEVVSEIRNYLSDILPTYMLPDTYIQLDRIPLTPNGKIDKKYLSNIEELSTSSEVEYVAPSDEIEEKLALIWREVLQKEKVGVKNSFFEMGGNSLKAIQITSRIRKEFNCIIDVAALYHNATIEGVKTQIENSTWINDQLEIKEENVETFSF